MWNKGILGKDTLDKLHSTLLFLLGINLALKAVDKNYYLCHEMPEKMSQLSVENDSKEVRCLIIYYEDTCTGHN